MTRAIRILWCCAAMFALTTSPAIAQEALTLAQYQRMVGEHKDRAIKKLAGDSAKDRYSALLDLLSCAELPSDVANTVIKYLADLRGEYPGNTVAGAAAELLEEHPEHARRAISELLKLLSYTEEHGYPAASAARALGAIDRRDLEEYVARMSAADRKALAAVLRPVIQSEVGSFETWARVSEIYSMLGRDAIGAVDAIRAKNTFARKYEKDNPDAMVVRLRSDSALRIIQSGWKAGDLQYIAEMHRADAVLGKLDAYIKPTDRFFDETKNLLALTKKAGIKTVYVIRHDNVIRDHNNFPFQARDGGIPMGELITNGFHSFLFEGLDPKGRALPQKPIILLTAAGKKAYAHTFHPDMTPEYSPLVQDFVFIEVGINGVRPLHQFFKALGISEGYDESILYVYWPRHWWAGVDKSLPEPPPKGKQLLWLKVSGELTSAGFDNK